MTYVWGTSLCLLADRRNSAVRIEVKGFRKAFFPLWRQSHLQSCALVQPGLLWWDGSGSSSRARGHGSQKIVFSTELQIRSCFLFSWFALALWTAPRLPQLTSWRWSSRLLKRSLRMYSRHFRKIFCGPWTTYFLFFSMWCYEPGGHYFYLYSTLLLLIIWQLASFSWLSEFSRSAVCFGLKRFWTVNCEMALSSEWG